MDIDRLRSDDLASLERFLRSADAATIFHRPEWHEIVQHTYGHRTDYWIARAMGEIVGVFPVTAVRFPVLGMKSIAMPYQFHSGLPLALAEEVQIDLVNRALVEARDAGASYVEIRHCGPAPILERLGFKAIDSGLVNTVVSLVGLTFNRVREGHRRNIVFAQRHGVRIEEETAVAALQRFHRMHAAESRAMGNPQGGYPFLRNLSRFGSDRCRLLLAYSGVECLGGLLTIADDRMVFARYGVSGSEAARRLYIGKALLWRAMSDASARGCVGFSLGVSSSRDAGLIQSKQGWNGQTEPVWLYVHPIKAMPRAPGDYFDRFHLAKAIWRKLPLPVVERLGTLATRWVC
ncbi:MAG TPA: GNAT family N-acetyltransferase [Vicinamibacterales bacterium]|nr:GNAT family N-acetyltransferase [Vicinamibacterales bacterium]